MKVSEPVSVNATLDAGFLCKTGKEMPNIGPVQGPTTQG